MSYIDIDNTEIRYNVLNGKKSYGGFSNW